MAISSRPDLLLKIIHGVQSDREMLIESECLLDKVTGQPDRLTLPEELEATLEDIEETLAELKEWWAELSGRPWVDHPASR